MEKVKVLIADDNVPFCEVLKKYLSQFDDIEVVGIANSDEEEILLIQKLDIDIVITDLMRNHKYSGLDIIKDCNQLHKKIDFIIISAAYEDINLLKDVKYAGYIRKPIFDYSIILNEIRRVVRENRQVTISEEKHFKKINILDKIINFLRTTRV